jgi:hypothetical protein
MKIDLKEIDNFLTHDELDFVRDRVLSTIPGDPNYSLVAGTTVPMVHSANYHIFDPADSRYQDVMAILMPKFQQHFHPELFIQQIHILDSIDPYRVHSDVESGYLQSPTPTTHAWTFIIPLDDYNSHTIVFNEGSEVKNLGEYIGVTQPYTSATVDDETYHKYFTHIPQDLFQWLTIDQIFKWKKGSMFAAPRFRFHTSDNFLANGLTRKQAIVAWTSVPT